MTAYEAARAARIAANRQKMEDMGVLVAAQQLQSKPARPRQPRSSKPRPAAEPLVVTRASKRRRESAEDTAQQVVSCRPLASAILVRAGHSQPTPAQTFSCHLQVDIDQLDQGSRDNRRKKKANRDPNQPRFELTSTQYAAPFLLTSVGKQPTVNECLYQVCVLLPLADTIHTTWACTSSAPNTHPPPLAPLPCCQV